MLQPEEARARMLRLWLALGTTSTTSTTSSTSTISVLTTQRAVVHADTLAPNAKQTLFAAANLVTPLGSYAHAVLRDEDVALIETRFNSKELRELLQHENIDQAA